MKKPTSSASSPAPAKESICSIGSVHSAFRELRQHEQALLNAGVDKRVITGVTALSALSFLPPTVATKCHAHDLSPKSQLLASSKAAGLAPLEPLSINHHDRDSPLAAAAKATYQAAHHHHSYSGGHIYAPQPQRRDAAFSPASYHPYYFAPTVYHAAEHPVAYPISPPRTPFYRPVDRYSPTSFSKPAAAVEYPSDKLSPKFEPAWTGKSSAEISPPPSSSGSEYDGTYEYVQKKLRAEPRNRSAQPPAPPPLQSSKSVVAKASKKDEGDAPPRYQCPDCKKSYSTLSGLTKHQEFHCSSQAKKCFSCKHCEKVYVSLGALKMHIRTHTLPCKCKLCGKAFR